MPAPSPRTAGNARDRLPLAASLAGSALPFYSEFGLDTLGVLIEAAVAATVAAHAANTLFKQAVQALAGAILPALG